jgi:hypothetical protein
LDRFHALKTEMPRSKMALLRGLYPEIAATLQMGHSLKDIHQRLVEDGVEVSYTVFLSYVTAFGGRELFLHLFKTGSH